MVLLVWIKSLTTVFDSPNVAYVCGQTIPWQFEEDLDPATALNSPLVKCLRKPDKCTAEHYYRDEGGVFEELGLEGVGVLRSLCSMPHWPNYCRMRLDEEYAHENRPTVCAMTSGSGAAAIRVEVDTWAIKFADVHP